MPGQIVISGQITGVEAGVVKPGPFSIPANSDSFFAAPSRTLAEGDNTVTLATWASGLLMIPPSGNAVALIIKGEAGDLGIPVSPNQPTFIPFPESPPDTIVVNAASDIDDLTTFLFF